MEQTKHKKNGMGGWVVVALLFGMLIWARLRLVTDIPRSAYAEPTQTPPRLVGSDDDAASADAGDAAEESRDARERDAIANAQDQGR